MFCITQDSYSCEFIYKEWKDKFSNPFSDCVYSSRFDNKGEIRIHLGWYAFGTVKV